MTVRRYLVLAGLVIAGCGTILSSSGASDTPDAGPDVSPSREDASDVGARDGAVGDVSANVDASPVVTGAWSCPPANLVPFKPGSDPSVCVEDAKLAGCTTVGSIPTGDPCQAPPGEHVYCTPCESGGGGAGSVYMKSTCICLPP
jgi:hypothetical protein